MGRAWRRGELPVHHVVLVAPVDGAAELVDILAHKLWRKPRRLHPRDRVSVTQVGGGRRGARGNTDALVIFAPLVHRRTNTRVLTDTGMRQRRHWQQG